MRGAQTDEIEMAVVASAIKCLRLKELDNEVVVVVVGFDWGLLWRESALTLRVWTELLLLPPHGDDDGLTSPIPGLEQ